MIYKFISTLLAFGMCLQGLSLFVPKAKEVNLSGIDLAKDSLVFESPLEVEILLLDSCNLVKLPVDIIILKKLKIISLNNNKKLDFHKAFKQLSELAKLDFISLSNNNLHVLPETIASLKTLRGLRLSNNSIDFSQANKELKLLPKLLRLWVDGNHLTELDTSFFTFPKLRFFYAYNNLIDTILLPAICSKGMWVLHLGNNRFNQLPANLSEVPSLRMVFFNDNRIRFIPERYASKKNYPFLALALDKNPLPEKEKEKARIYFHSLMLFTM